MLRATTACTFSTSQLPKVVRGWCVLYILTWKCASRHNGVHFFISHLASWVRTRRFSEPTFRPSGATNHWKNTVNRDFPTFSRICIFFLLIFSLLTLLTSAFQLSILSEVSLLNFLRSYSVDPQYIFKYYNHQSNILFQIMKHNILNLRTTRPLYFDGETLQKLGNQDAASGCGEKRRICRDAFEPSPRLFLTARIRRFTQWVVRRIYIYIYTYGDLWDLQLCL